MEKVAGNNEAEQLLNGLLAEKQQKLSETQKVDIGGAAWRVVGGTVAAYLAGVTAFVGTAIGFFTNKIRKNPEVRAEIEALASAMERYGNNYSGREREIEELAGKLAKNFEKEAPHILQHPTGWTKGLALVGAGAGLLAYTNNHDKKVEVAQGEFDKIKTIHSGWRERIVSEEKTASVSEKSL